VSAEHRASFTRRISISKILAAATVLRVASNPREELHLSQKGGDSICSGVTICLGGCKLQFQLGYGVPAEARDEAVAARLLSG
jgi:hypothetical protein